MKEEIVQTLITARMLFDKAQELCIADDKYVASAGLVILQDAVELVLNACIVELEIDQMKTIDRMSFDELLGQLQSELQKSGKTIIKIQKLKAMNKERVIVKHYGHFAEPSTVRNFFESAKDSTDNLLCNVVGKDLQQVMLHEVIKPGDAKDFIQAACESIEKGNYFDVLVNTRKAIYVEIEEEYLIEGWKDYTPQKDLWSPYFFLRGGWKAPIYTRNKEWIDEHVKDPFDYIRLDHEKLRLDLIEWGITTQDFWNIWRLTPEVYRFMGSKKWIMKGELKYFREAATEENAKYCLDLAITVIVKKQRHRDLSRYLSSYYEFIHRLRVKIKKETPLYKKASKNSDIEQMLQVGLVLGVNYVITGGLDEETTFVHILNYEKDEGETLIIGYVDVNACEILEDTKKESD